LESTRPLTGPGLKLSSIAAGTAAATERAAALLCQGAAVREVAKRCRFGYKPGLPG
jgi:hypothetical protein